MVAKGNKIHKKKPGRYSLKHKDLPGANEHDTSKGNKHDSENVIGLLFHLGLEGRSLNVLDFCRYLSFNRGNQNLSSSPLHVAIQLILSASSLSQ
jgi:hypothetical protein